jgi:hypothetical protein
MSQCGACEELPAWDPSLFIVAVESLMVKPYCSTVLTKNGHDTLGRQDESLLTNGTSIFMRKNYLTKLTSAM